MRGVLQIADHLVDGVFQGRDFAFGLHGDRPCQIALGNSHRDFGDRAYLGGQIRGELIDVFGQPLPRSRRAGHLRLAAELAFHTDLARHAGDLVSERRQCFGHAVDRLSEFGDLALGVNFEFQVQVAVGNGSHDFGNTAHLARQVARHEIDVVGEVLPGTRHAFHLCLAAQAAFRADLARDARDLRGERAELVDHGVDGVLELFDLALDVDRNLFREVARRHGGRDLGDVTNLAGQVAGHEVDALGEVLPRTRHAFHVSLAAKDAFGTYLACHTSDFRGERSKLIDHRVDGVLELENLSLDVDRDFLRKVAGGHRLRDLGDVTNLTGKVAGHEIDALGEVFPGA